MRSTLMVLLMFTLSGCATVGRNRIFLGAGIGAALGATSGALLSPNSENRGLNALVFGLSGVVVGGLAGLLTDTSSSSSNEAHTLKEREESLGRITQEFSVRSAQELPSFLKERLQPVVIEEFVESDSVSEDGTLHEPHKVYRIKRQSELFSKPARNTRGESK